ncbi:reverse transcriptase domain-containing protein [Tanacetum coccineum]
MMTQNNELKNMMANFFQMQHQNQNQSTSGSGSLPSNTVANSRGDLKAITTRSGVAYDGPMIPPTSSSIPKNCSAMLLKKLPEKLGDPGKCLIPCDFSGMVECLALADLGASINLMPLSVWKKLSLPDLTSILVDFDADPRVPLILRRPFLRTARALIDVYGEEITLKYNDEAITFNFGCTSSHSYRYDDASVNRNDVKTLHARIDAQEQCDE